MNKVQISVKASTALSIISIGGIVASAIFAARDRKKADEKLQDRNVSELKPVEFIKDIIPCYIPTISCVVGTSLCVVGAGVLSKKSQASLVGAFEITRSMYEEYRQAAKDVYGADADDKIKEAILERKVSTDQNLETCANGIGGTYRTNLDNLGSDETVLFYEEIGQTYIETTLNKLKDAMYHLNRNFILRGGYAQFIEFYDMLNVRDYKPTVGLESLCWHGGDEFGCQMPIEKSMDVGIDELWFSRGDSGYEWIDYYIRETDTMVGNQKVYRICFPFMPDVCDDIY